ncbi:MAG: DUF2065 domain-containing protein [Proteobacteria bacterium]|nr:DUF2065 domain-containing protein [Pseudomonadota bacterium]MBK9252473.1 DUF2065 domain-containing protein [Pseudomonadota bacterium]
MAWSDLLAAVAILLVLEGVLPFINPNGTRRVFQQLSKMMDRELRVAGFIAMAAGLVLLFVVRS